MGWRQRKSIKRRQAAQVSPELRQKLEAATEEFLARQENRSQPAGEFDSDGAWHPTPREMRPCCWPITVPHRLAPYALLMHCRSFKHLATLYGVSERDLQGAVRAAREELRNYYYLPLAKTEDGLYGLDNGEPYALGLPACKERAGGWLYAYATLEEAICAYFPVLPKLAGAKRVIARVKAEGAHCRDGRLRGFGSKYAFTYIQPVQLLEVSQRDVGRALAVKAAAQRAGRTP